MKKLALAALLVSACAPLPSYHVRTQPEPYGSVLVTVEPLAPLSPAAAEAAWKNATTDVMLARGCKLWSSSPPRIRWFVRERLPGTMNMHERWPGAEGLVACTLPYTPAEL